MDETFSLLFTFLRSEKKVYVNNNTETQNARELFIKGKQRIRSKR